MKGESTANTRLVKEALAGSEEAYRELVTTFGPPLATFLAGFLKRREDIEEIVQLAFFRAFRRLDCLRSPEIFGSWLWRIAYCATIDLQRKGQRSVIDDSPMLEETWLAIPGEAPSVEICLERQQLIEQVRTRFAELPESMRQVLLLRYREEWSYREIAEHLGISAVQIKARLARARQKLEAKTSDLATEWRRISDEMS